jgi:hypothetical protein
VTTRGVERAARTHLPVASCNCFMEMVFTLK